MISHVIWAPLSACNACIAELGANTMRHVFRVTTRALFHYIQTLVDVLLYAEAGGREKRINRETTIRLTLAIIVPARANQSPRTPRVSETRTKRIQSVFNSSHLRDDDPMSADSRFRELFRCGKTISSPRDDDDQDEKERKWMRFSNGRTSARSTAALARTRARARSCSRMYKSCGSRPGPPMQACVIVRPRKRVTWVRTRVPLRVGSVIDGGRA